MGSMTLLLPIALVGIVLVFMMFNKKNKTKQDEVVAMNTKPEHVVLIKKWLKEKKHITSKTIHVNLLSEVPSKFKSKEDRSKNFYVIIFKTYDSKTKITSPEYAIKVEGQRERVSKSDYKYKYIVIEEMDSIDVRKKFEKEISNQSKAEKKHMIQKQKALEKQKQRELKLKNKKR